MITFRLALMIIGLMLLIADGVQIQAPRVNLQSLGLACWLLAVLAPGM
jgi:hypothetical protein